MAAGGSFKQQCPSCDAMVLVKDRKLIGKKIDCTSCKFRFLVEPPAGEAEEEPKEEAKAPAKGAPTKKPAATKPGAAPAKKKVGPRKPLETDDDEQEAEAQKEGRNNTMIIGIGLAVFCVLLLGVGGYFLLSDTGTGPISGPPQTRRTQPTKGEVVIPPPQIKDTGEVPTNLLPNDTQVVMNVYVNGPVTNAALYTPGAFSPSLLEKKLGLKAMEVEGIVVGLNLEGKKGWAFAVVRILPKKSLDEGALKTALNLQPAPGGAIKGKEYFVTPPSLWLGNLERTVLQATPGLGDIAGDPEPRSLAVYIMNPTTLIVADVAPLKEILEAGGTPKALSAPPSAGGKKGDEDRDRYLTINPALKQALDRVEGKTYKERRLSLAWDMKAVNLDKARASIRKQSVEPLVAALALPLGPMADHLGEVTVGAVGLKMNDKQGTVTLALENKDKATADFWQETFRAISPKAGDAAVLAKLLPVPVEIGGRIIGPGGDAMKWSVSSAAQDTIWTLSIETPLNSLNTMLAATLPKATVWLRTMSGMAEGPTRIFELAAATRTLAEDGKQRDPKDDDKVYQGFPIGTWPRKLGGDRLGRPYPPYERVGWMPQLLPYLGYESASKEIQLHLDDAWRDPRSKNAEIGAIMVPGFLDSRYPRNTWTATIRDPAGVPMTLGATHFVGVAGVGLDAADYPITDRRCGVFGYDRVTKLDDIKDGRATTILMLQVPPTYPRPWIAGGGATIMGVPEKNSVKPFVLPILHDGKKGTYAIMADGSVRFIPETIPDDVFKAMCTINGGEKVDPDKETVRHELKGILPEKK